MHQLLNHMANIAMKPLLQSPLHVVASGRIMLITFTGRKSGKIYTTPVEYQRTGDTLMLFTQKSRTWWKNLEGGAPVTVCLHGQEMHGQADVSTNSESVYLGLKSMYPRATEEWTEQTAPDLVMITVQV
jgi:deazaflavin-dependent oxidoreductase (nitroreductase family)